MKKNYAKHFLILGRQSRYFKHGHVLKFYAYSMCHGPFLQIGEVVIESLGKQREQLRNIKSDTQELTAELETSKAVGGS